MVATKATSIKLTYKINRTSNQTILHISSTQGTQVKGSHGGKRGGNHLLGLGTGLLHLFLPLRLASLSNILLCLNEHRRNVPTRTITTQPTANNRLLRQSASLSVCQSVSLVTFKRSLTVINSSLAASWSVLSQRTSPCARCSSL